MSAKAMLIGVNSLTFTCGFILFVGGIVINAKYASMHDEWKVGNGFYNGSVLCIFLGLMVSVISATGLLGAVKENRCILTIFNTLLGITIFLQISLSIALFSVVHNKHLGIVVRGQMRESLERFDNDEGISKVWNIMQTELRCCGVDGPEDWLSTNQNLPDSCCTTLDANRNSVCRLHDDKHPSHKIGCLKAMEQSIKRNEAVIAVIVAITAFVQIGLIVASCHLMKSTKKPDSCFPFY